MMRVSMAIWKPAVAVAAVVATLSSAQAEFFGLRIPFLDQTDTATPEPPSSSDWSGMSGASGHPLMTAEAIRSAAANFATCLQELWPEAARRGVSRKTFDAQTTGLVPDLKIMDLLDSQPEFTRAVWDYLDLLVNEPRIQKGREILAKYRPTFDAVEKVYGVDRDIIVAIWGVESNYGAAIGDRSVVRSTATLACIGRRQNYFRDEFLDTLEILEHGDVLPEHLVGSWAGAFGPTQFMPSAFKRYAVDFDRDGRRDVVDSVPDVVASTANNLKLDGWVPGQAWGYEVAVPQGFNYLLAGQARELSIREWQGLGVHRVNGKLFPRPTDRAYLLAPAGARGPSFLMLENFHVIMKYNPAEAYALAIGYLADRLRGEGPLVQPWPRDERVLTLAERYELQQLLVSRGFDVGGDPDGQLGPKSRVAIMHFQVASGLVPDGFASSELLDRLRVQGNAN
jgi:membrane-bound lytic murein transglycosylase B